MSREQGRIDRTTGVYVHAFILIGAAALFHSIWDLIRNPIDPKWLILALLTVSTGWIMMRIPSISDVSFSISDTFNIAAAVLFGPSAGAVTAALDGLVLSYQFASCSRRCIASSSTWRCRRSRSGWPPTSSSR